jgi:hypothetical protein
MKITTQLTMTAAQAFAEVARRQISIVPSFDGKFWTASVDEKGDTFASKKRKVRMISATSSTPIGAVRELIAKIDGAYRETDDFEGGWS